jgi:hypothetical protein
MSLSTWLGLADEPAVLDRYGPIRAALARQIARDAARDHPTTTTWRCVITDDRHRTSSASAIPYEHRDTTLRRGSPGWSPRCTRSAPFRGCSVRARRCDLDHRVPFDHADPASGGLTCPCNLHPLCGTDHRLKTARTITPAPIAADGPSTVLGTLGWSTVTGHTYRQDPSPPLPAPAHPDDVACAAAADVRRRAEKRDQRSADPDLDDRWNPCTPYRQNRANPNREGKEPSRASPGASSPQDVVRTDSPRPTPDDPPC